MLITEAAEYLVNEYTSVTKPRLSDMSRIISVLCHLYPAVPTVVVMQEVVRNFSGSKRQL